MHELKKGSQKMDLIGLFLRVLIILDSSRYFHFQNQTHDFIQYSILLHCILINWLIVLITMQVKAELLLLRDSNSLGVNEFRTRLVVDWAEESFSKGSCQPNKLRNDIIAILDFHAAIISRCIKILFL